MNRIMKFLAVLLVILGVVVSTACTAGKKVRDGAVYGEYPHADILATADIGYDSARVICTEDSKIHVLLMYDDTFLVTQSVRKRGDAETDKALCGKELEELRRLAKIGQQYDKKPGQ